MRMELGILQQEIGKFLLLIEGAEKLAKKDDCKPQDLARLLVKHSQITAEVAQLTHEILEALDDEPVYPEPDR